MSDKTPTLRLPIPGPAHTDDVAEILAAIAALGARVDARMDAMEARLAALDARREAINQRLAPILAEVEANLDAMQRGGP